MSNASSAPFASASARAAICKSLFVVLNEASGSLAGNLNDEVNRLQHTGFSGSTGGAGLRIKSFRMEHLASDRVEIDVAFDMRVVSKDCGFYFNGVISAV